MNQNSKYKEALVSKTEIKQASARRNKMAPKILVIQQNKIITSKLR